MQDLVHLTEGQRLQLLAELDALETQIDFLFIDTGAGISANVMYFNMAAQDIMVVVTPEPTSMTDAYALMKVLATKYVEKNFKVVLNAVANAMEAKDVFRRLSTVAERFLNISLDYLGICGIRHSIFAGCTSAEAITGTVPRLGGGRLLSQPRPACARGAAWGAQQRQYPVFLAATTDEGRAATGG